MTDRSGEMAATIAEAAPLFGQAGTRLLVRGRDGSVVGVLERERVSAMMMQG